MSRLVLLLGILLLVPVLVSAQVTEKEVFVTTDTINKNKKIQVLALPIVFYSPETEFAFGGGGQLFLLGEKSRFRNRISNIFFTAIYTSRNQVIIEFLPEIYLASGNYFIDMAYRFEIFPNSFWGIGPTTPEDNEEIYDQTTHFLDIQFLKRLPPNLNFGLLYHFSHHDVTEVQEGGILDSGTVEGSDGATISGLGALFNLDDRDDVGSATSGNYLSLLAKFSSELLGATNSYNKYILDLRTYRPIGKKSVLALQVYSENTFGDVPFQGLAAYGGSKGARGYFKGRFLDKHMYVLQGEYRYRFLPRWTLAGFGLVGSVDDRLTDLWSFNNLKPAVGGGIRFKVVKDKSTWLRFDFGKGIDGQSGIYFGVNEVF